MGPQRLAQLLPAPLCADWLARVAAGPARSSPLTELPLDAQAVLQAVAASAARPLLETALGPAPWCNLSQSWLRHGRPPHSWHQDGALRHDFLVHAGRHLPAPCWRCARCGWH